MKRIYLLFLSSLGLFLLNLLAANTGFQRPVWVSSYLNDFLCMPLVLGISLLIIQKLKQDESIRISLFTAFSLAAMYSLIFELVLPQLMSRYTADVYDVLLYYGGALLFVVLQKASPSPSIFSKA